MRSSSYGALLRLPKRSVIYADSQYELTSAWPSRALSHVDIRLSAVAFWPGRRFRLSRRRDPAPVGVSCTVQVESSLLLCTGIDESPKEGTFCFRPAPVNSGGSIIMFRYFRAYVNFFPFILRPRCRPRASAILTEPGGIPPGAAMRTPFLVVHKLRFSGVMAIAAARQTSARSYRPRVGLARQIPVGNFP